MAAQVATLALQIRVPCVLFLFGWWEKWGYQIHEFARRGHAILVRGDNLRLLDPGPEKARTVSTTKQFSLTNIVDLRAGSPKHWALKSRGPNSIHPTPHP